jgi:hypothetical protein
LAVLAKDGQGGNLDINGNLLPKTDQGLFPEHVLALVAEKDVYQRGQYVTAPIYGLCQDVCVSVCVRGAYRS